MDVDDEPIPGLGADGRPDPEYARRLGLVPAPGGRRAAAFALDALAWIVLALPGAIGVAMIARRDRGRRRRCRRGPARCARPSARARGREPGPARGLRHRAARAARSQGRHARQGELRHPIGERGPVRPCGLLARRAARPRALGRPARAALRRARAALRLVGLGSRAPRPQLARPGGALLRDRRQARPEPARFARAAPRAPSDGGARSGRGRRARRRSPATVRPARTCSSRRRARARAWSPRSRSRRGHGCRPSSRRRPRGRRTLGGGRARRGIRPVRDRTRSVRPRMPRPPRSSSSTTAPGCRRPAGSSSAAARRRRPARHPPARAPRRRRACASRRPTPRSASTTRGAGSPTAPRRTAPWCSPDGSSHRLDPGVRTPVATGARVVLGGRSFTVTVAPGR